MRRSLYYSLLSLLLLTVSHASAQFKVDLRAGSIIPGGGPYDVHFNSMSAATFAGLGTDSMSALQPSVDLPSSPLNVRFSAAGTGPSAPIIERDVALTTQTEYVFLAYGTSASPKLKVLTRSKTQVPGGGKSLLRFFNASTIAGGLDFHLMSIDSAAIFASVAADSATPFKSVDAVAVSLVITRAGSSEVLGTLTIPLIAAGRLTVAITGSTKDDLGVMLMQGSLTTGYHIPTLKVTGGGGGTLPVLRVVHLWPQEPLSGQGYQKLDIFLNDLTLPSVGALPYRTASELLGPITDDTTTVRFARENEGLGSPVLVTRVPMDLDSAYDIILTRFTNGTAVAMTLTAPVFQSQGLPNDTIMLRVAQAADGFGPVDIRLISMTTGDTTRVDNLGFLVASPFRPMPTGQVQIEVSRDENDTPFYTRTTDMFELGSFGYYTILLSGTDSTFKADVMGEAIAQRQAFDPAADVPVVTPGPLAGAISIAPNPVVDAEPHLHLSLQRTARISLSVVDAAGRTVVAPSVERLRPAGDVDIVVPTTGLAAGTYTCVVRVDGVPTARMLVIGE